MKVLTVKVNEHIIDHDKSFHLKLPLFFPFVIENWRAQKTSCGNCDMMFGCLQEREGLTRVWEPGIQITAPPWNNYFVKKVRPRVYNSVVAVGGGAGNTVITSVLRGL